MMTNDTSPTRLEKAAEEAERRLIEAAERAQKTLDDAAARAAKTLERSGDSRNLNGSYQWERGDRSAYSERIRDLEHSKGKLDERIGKLEVGQAERQQQIIGVVNDVAGLVTSLAGLRSDFEAATKEAIARMTTLRELTLEVKDACNLKVEQYREENQKDKIKNQQYIIGVVVGFVVTVVLSILFGYQHLLR
jgi:chromosome segregation ATPase